MENKIQELTDKLVKEGIEKGKNEGDKIISEANDKAASIIDDAKKEAEAIISEAQKKAAELDKNTKSELKMLTKQALDALKSEIANVMSENIIKDCVGKTVADPAFMNTFVLKVAEKWAENEDIVISAKDAESLKALFASKAKNLLDKNVKIKQVNGQKADFEIEPADGSYKVKFGEEEFENYFKSFLRPQLIDMLFKG